MFGPSKEHLNFVVGKRAGNRFRRLAYAGLWWTGVDIKADGFHPDNIRVPEVQHEVSFSQELQKNWAVVWVWKRVVETHLKRRVIQCILSIGVTNHNGAQCLWGKERASSACSIQRQLRFNSFHYSDLHGLEIGQVFWSLRWGSAQLWSCDINTLSKWNELKWSCFCVWKSRSCFTQRKNRKKLTATAAQQKQKPQPDKQNDNNNNY